MRRPEANGYNNIYKMLGLHWLSISKFKIFFFVFYFFLDDLFTDIC